jgi:hypothetical protein
MRDERRSNCLTNATATARASSAVKGFACRAANRCRPSSIDAARPSKEGPRSSIPGDRTRTHRCVFPPILRLCRHDDSHFLRAVWTKQHPGGSRGCLARHMHRHDEFLPVGKTSPVIRLVRRPSCVCMKLLTQLDQTDGTRPRPLC